MNHNMMMAMMTLAMVTMAMTSMGVSASVEASACSTTVGTNTFDFSSLMGRTYTASDGTYEYDFAVCGSPTTKDPTHCESKGAWSCQFLNTSQTATMLGAWAAGAATWSTSPSGAPMYSTSNGDVCFTTGKPRVATIEFVCDKDAPVGAITIADANCEYSFTFNTKYACPGTKPGPGPGHKKGKSGGLSGGWVFMIILLVCVPVYIVAGCAWNIKKRGATTWSERCPQYGLWAGLVALTKEGCLFTYGKIRQLMGGGGGSSAGGTGEGYNEF